MKGVKRISPIKEIPFALKTIFKIMIRLESNRANGQIASFFMLK